MWQLKSRRRRFYLTVGHYTVLTMGPPRYFGAVYYGGAAIVTVCACTLGAIAHNKLAVFPLLLAGSGVVTATIVKGWTSGWCGARIQRDLAEGTALVYLIGAIAGQIAGLLFYLGSLFVHGQPSFEMGTRGGNSLISLLLLGVLFVMAEAGGAYFLALAIVMWRTRGRAQR